MSSNSSSAVALSDSSGLVHIVTDNGTVENLRWVIKVDVVMLLLTCLGASAILLNMFYNEWILRRAATVRMRLVQALVMSDFLLGISALVPSLTKLNHKTISHGSHFCNGFGTLLVAAIWGEHIWTLILAVATYLILIHPLHILTRMLDKRWIWLYLLVWTLCFAVAVIGYELFGYYPSGGVCYYGTNAGLYGELIQFIPRGIVFVVVILIYSRLHSFLKRPDRIKGSFSKSTSVAERNSSGQTSNDSNFVVATEDELGRDSRGRGRLPSRGQLMNNFRRFSFHAKGNPNARDEERGPAGDNEEVKAKDFASSEKTVDVSTSPRMTTDSRFSQATITPAALPPWERLELPAFQIGNQRYGGSASQSGGSFWDWKGGSNRPRSSQSTAASFSVRPTSPTSPTSKAFSPNFSRRERRRTEEMSNENSLAGRLTPANARMAMGRSASIPEGNPFITSPTMPEDSESLTPPGTSMGAPRRNHPGSISLSTAQQAPIMCPYPSPLSPTNTSAHVFPSDPAPPLSTSGSFSTNHSASLPSVIDTPNPNILEPAIRRGSEMVSEAEYGRRGSGPVTFSIPATKSFIDNQDIRRGSLANSSRRGSADYGDDIPRSGSLPRPSQKGADGDDEDEELDLARILAESYDDNRLPTSRDPRRGSDETEWQQESMSSYLNRKTAMLMLYFPLAYMILFSVSLIRIIWDFTGTSEPTALLAISRWLVFAQGLVDAIIYGFVEWNTKRLVRRKVAKGALSPGHSKTGSRGSLTGEGFRFSNLRRSTKQASKSQASQPISEAEEAAFRGVSVSQG